MMPKNKNRPASGKRSWIFVAIAAALILSIGAVAWTMRSVAAPTAVAAVKSERITLDPSRFFGAAREAYEVAAKRPALLVQLHCYCGCDKELGHQCLLDCYRDEHGAHCPVCTGEALEAAKLADEGLPVDQIRHVLRDDYAQGN
jgi:Protein of unknown function with PCYCGC motif